MESALKISNLAYAFKSDWTFLRKPFIKDLSLDIAKGESFGFLGHNGAGKTTTIKCILGLIKPIKGSIEIYGKSYKDWEARQVVGFLPEQPYFYDHLTVNELLYMYGTLKGMSRSDIKSQTARVLEQVKMDHKAKAKLRNLSKGQVQRAGMAQALLGDPQLLILDEPFSGLDPIGRKEFADLLFSLKKEGVTIFVSSHILSDIEFLCDRVGILLNGDLQGVFKLDDLPELLPGEYHLKVKGFENVMQQLEALAIKVQNHEKFLNLSFDNWENAEKALDMAVESDAYVEEFRFVHGGLEQLFIDITNKK